MSILKWKDCFGIWALGRLIWKLGNLSILFHHRPLANTFQQLIFDIWHVFFIIHSSNVNVVAFLLAKAQWWYAVFNTEKPTEIGASDDFLSSLRFYNSLSTMVRRDNHSVDYALDDFTMGTSPKGNGLCLEFGISFFVTCLTIVANSWLASCKLSGGNRSTRRKPPHSSESLTTFSHSQAGIRTKAEVGNGLCIHNYTKRVNYVC